MKVGLARQVINAAVIQSGIQVVVVIVITLVGYLALERSGVGTIAPLILATGFVGVLISLLLGYGNVKRLKSVLGEDIDANLALLNDLVGAGKVPFQAKKPFVGGVSLKILRAIEGIQNNFEPRETLGGHSQGLAAALEHIDAMFMIVDDKQVVTYLNRPLREMFRKNSSQLRSVLPAFDLDSLVGQSLAPMFHAENINPDPHSDIFNTHTFKLNLGSLRLSLTVTPIISHQGDLTGSVYHWQDDTEREKVEFEIESVVNASINGELDRRIKIIQKQGFHFDISNSINLLLDDNARIFSKMNDVLSSLSQGDFQKALFLSSSDPSRDIERHLNETISSLNNILSEAQLNSIAVHRNISNISSSCNDLYHRNRAQADDLVSLAALMEKMTSRVEDHSENAKQAHMLSAGVRQQAENGGKVVQLAIAAMSEINVASSQISEVIGVIDEISFQTNMLALNAAVEAAHAGDEGRGFAVVAAEVKNLSQRSSEAVKEIKSLIENSINKINGGIVLVDETGQALMDVVKSAKSVSYIIDAMDAENQEHSNCIENFNRGIRSIEEESRSNIEVIKETALSVDDLDLHSTALATQLSFFNIVPDDNSIAIRRANSEIHIKSTKKPIEPTMGSFESADSIQY